MCCLGVFSLHEFCVNSLIKARGEAIHLPVYDTRACDGRKHEHRRYHVCVITVVKSIKSYNQLIMLFSYIDRTDITIVCSSFVWGQDEGSG